MDMMPNLSAVLLELLYELRNEDLPLIIGGGFGIYLKQEYLRQHGLRTMFREWPEARRQPTTSTCSFVRNCALTRPG